MLKRDHFTILIVPAAASDKVRRFQLSSRWAGATISAVVLLLLVNLLGMSGLLAGVWTSGERARLEAENASYREQLGRYQDMAESLSSQLGTLQQSETRLKTLVKDKEPRSSKSARSTAPADTSPTTSKDGGKGGLETGDLSRLSPSADSGIDLDVVVVGGDPLLGAFLTLQHRADTLEASLQTMVGQAEAENARRRIRPSIMPLRGAISSEFGHRVSPFTGMDQFHEGLDIEADVGDPVRATADGIVVSAGWSSGLGQLVEIKHENGIVTRYGHNSKLLVRRGQRVQQGDIISRAGMTGRTTGCHVHYEVVVNGRNVNPRKYLND